MPKIKSNYECQIKFRGSYEFLRLVEEGKHELGKKLENKFREQTLSNDESTLEELRAILKFRDSLRYLKTTDFYRLIVLKWAFENVPHLISRDIPELVDLKEQMKLMLKKSY